MKNLAFVGLLMLQPRAAVQDPIEDLQSRDAKVRFAAARSLASSGSMGERQPDALPALAHALKDPDAKVRVTVAFAISTNVVPPAKQKADRGILIPALVAALKDPEPMVREYCAASLATLDRDALPALKELLHSMDPVLRARAASILASMGKQGRRHDDALLPLAQALKDHDQQVRAAAAQALRWNVVPPAQQKADHKALIAALIGGLKDGDPTVCVACTDCLATLDRDALPALLDILKGSDDALRAGAAFSIYTMAISGRRHPEAVPALQHAMKTGNERVRSLAEHALKQIEIFD